MLLASVADSIFRFCAQYCLACGALGIEYPHVGIDAVFTIRKAAQCGGVNGSPMKHRENNYCFAFRCHPA
jgi:hypothetical protein